VGLCNTRESRVRGLRGCDTDIEFEDASPSSIGSGVPSNIHEVSCGDDVDEERS